MSNIGLLKEQKMDRMEELKEKILHEICLCCVHKPLEIHEGMYHDSPKTYVGTGCYKGFEKGRYCDLAHKALKAILALFSQEAEAIRKDCEIEKQMLQEELYDRLQEAREQERERILNLIKPHISDVNGYIHISFGKETWQALSKEDKEG